MAKDKKAAKSKAATKPKSKAATKPKAEPRAKPAQVKQDAPHIDGSVSQPGHVDGSVSKRS